MSLVWENYRKGGSEKLAMLALADWCNDQGGSLHPSINAIARKINVSESQARRIVHGFIKDGYLEVIGNHDGGNPGQSRQYRLIVEKLATPSMDATRTPSTSATPSADATPSMDARLPLAPMRETPSTHDTLTIKNQIQNHQSVVRNVVADCPHQEIISLYHKHLPMLTQVRSWTEKRSKQLKARWRENPKHQTLEFWERLFEYVAKSDFLTGKASAWQADLEWITKSENFVKIIEGKYENKAQP